MISTEKAHQLIGIYYFVCDAYDSHLKNVCQRFSPNQNYKFTDQEIMTIYLFAVSNEQKFKIKQIYDFAKDYLYSWFPALPSYPAFDTRLNNLTEAFKLLSNLMLTKIQIPPECSLNVSVLDSLPIITCSGKRSGSVAKELTDKGFCSTKGMYYFGVKLHSLAFYRPGSLPIPESIMISPASENDLNVFKYCWSDINNRYFFGDKIYFDQPYFEQLKNEKKSVMLTPVKAVKNEADVIRKRDKAYNDLFSAAVSRVRQPIESSFNWIIEKTDIQRASKVRSTKGLLIHIFGKISAALWMLFFNP